MQDENIQVFETQDDITIQEASDSAELLDMSNENVNVETQENNVSIDEIEENVVIEEVWQTAEVTESSEDIETDETVVDSDTAISHQDLVDTALADLHPITSISGLSNKLKELEQLKQVLSTGRDFAQYYVWNDGNPLKENRIGYFVTFADNTDYIKICDNADEDVIGVVVSANTVGFIGGQSDDVIANSHKYGLVCLIGSAMVRRVSTVNVGDYVIPNALGMAQTSYLDAKMSVPYFETITITNKTTYQLSHLPANLKGVYLLLEDGTLGSRVTVGSIAVDTIISMNNTLIEVSVGGSGFNEGDKLFFIYTYETSSNLGYKVTAISYEAGVHYARINVLPNGNALARIEENIDILSNRLTANESNVTIAINRANDAYELIETGGGAANVEITNRLDKIESDVQQAQNAADSATSKAEQVENDIASSIEELEINTNKKIEEARKEFNETNQTINDIKKVTDYINEWKNEDGSQGAEYLLNYIDNDLATKAEVQVVERNVESAYTAIAQNAKEIQLISSSVQKYCVGEYSQADGLTLDEAKSILPVGALYAPNIDHTEKYATDEGDILKTFYRGYSYVWNGVNWVESSIENVIFSDVYVNPSAGTTATYWCVGSDYDGETYEKDALYEGTQGQWVKVGSLSDSSVSRIASAVRVMANELALEVIGNEGYAGIKARVEDAEVAIENITNLTTDDSSALALLKQQVTDNKANISQLTEFTYTVATDSTRLTLEEIKEGVYYVTQPIWDDENNKWIFEGNAQSKPGFYDGAEYCYAENVNNSQTYLQYICDTNNQWYVVERGINKSLAAIQQQADANGASIGLIVKNGDVDGASIIAAVNKRGDSEVQIEGKHVNLKGVVTFESFDDDTKQQIEADTIDVQIWSSRGNIFKSRDVNSILSCHVFKGGVDITDTLQDKAFTWHKYNNDGTEDKAFRPNLNTGRNLTISHTDVASRAVFQCAVDYNLIKEEIMEE